MAYQKLQAIGARKLIPSDTIGIPSTASAQKSGTDAAGTANKLTVDSTEGLQVGFIVVNTSAGNEAIATITAIDSATVCSLSADIMDAAETYTVYESAEENGAAIYVAGTGDVKVMMASGDIITFTTVAASTFMPIQALQVFETGTSATGLVALW